MIYRFPFDLCPLYLMVNDLFFLFNSRLKSEGTSLLFISAIFDGK